MAGAFCANAGQDELVPKGRVSFVASAKSTSTGGLEFFNETPISSFVRSSTSSELSLTQRAILVGTGVAKIVPLAAMCGAVVYLGWAAIKLPQVLLSPDMVGASMAYLAHVNPLQVAPLTTDLVRGVPYASVNVLALAGVEAAKQNAHWAVPLGTGFLGTVTSGMHATAKFVVSTAFSGLGDIYRAARG